MPARKKHIVITTNIYRKIPKTKNDFDHPTKNNLLYKQLHPKLTPSLLKQELPKNSTLTLHVLVSCTTPISPSSIKALKDYLKPLTSRIDLKIFTFENTLAIQQLNHALFDLNSYPGIRNTALVLAYQDKADWVIIIDSDEELPDNYLANVLSTLEKNPKIKALSRFYLEEGRRLSPLQDPLESWPKYSAMNVDATQLIAENKVAESFFGKGGNMILAYPFYSKMCFPTDIPRGEDLAFILRTWLIYYNGNPRAGIKPKDTTFKFFLNPKRNMAVIHHTKHLAIRNFLDYLERNLARFAIETNTILHQKGLSTKDLITRSTYMGKVIFLPNFPVVVNTIYKELHQKTRKGTLKLTNPVTVALRASHHPQEGCPAYTKKQIEASKARLLRLWKNIESKNYFLQYQKEQSAYIKALKSLKKV